MASDGSHGRTCFDEAAQPFDNRVVMHRDPPAAARETRPRLTRAGSAAARTWRASSLAVTALLAGYAAAQPVVHEYIELGPGRGLVEPPVGPTRNEPPPTAGSPAGQPGAASEASSSGAGMSSTFSIDRDTTRPERVSYGDPFTPTVVPFKRSMVYDAVNRDADLSVRDAQPVPVETLAQARPNDEHFHASLRLSLVAGQRMPIPSVAPGSRLVVAHSEPPVDFRIGVDSAENWFVESSATREVQLTLQVVADRRVFGSPFRDSSWSELGRALPPLPAVVKNDAREVARTLGVAENARPREAVATLVEHFRRFSPSSRRPTGQGLALYREIALTARGICRHRAYAFMITALGLGVPTRMAMNEAHAWVEVFDGEIWHRIDLGGAADELDMADEDRPRHVEPRDPFAWPDRSESGLALAERRGIRGAEAASGAPSSAGQPSPGAVPPSTAGGAGAPGTREQPAPPPPGSEPDPLGAARPWPPEQPVDPAGAEEPSEASLRTRVRFTVATSSAERGKGLFVSGHVHGQSRACSGVRVDIGLALPEARPLPLGTLVSDDRGDFRGHLVIPWSAPLGQHELVARVRGECAGNVPTR